MDTLSAKADRPLYVDLDGTLVRSDLLWESLFLFARQKPLEVWRVFGWALAGKARLKAELAGRIEVDPATWPYREDVVETLRTEREAGRRIVLATAADERLAKGVADHLGFFDEVIASDGETNLSAERKLERIRADRAGAPFDYMGNSRDDLCLFEAAEHATVVQPDRHAARWHRGATRECRLIRDEKPVSRSLLKAMRPHQWMKNVLIFVPIVLNHEYLDIPMVLAGLLAFVCFSMAASSVYLFNDLLDLAADRRHSTKRHRPFASGQVPIPIGVGAAVGLLVGAFGLSLLLPAGFTIVLAAYLGLTTAYSLALKRMLLIDVLTLASLYTLRILAGAASADTVESFWLLAFSLFFFFSLALVKRYVELAEFGEGASRQTTGRGYVPADLDTLAQAGMASGFSSVLVLALYIDSAEIRQLQAHPYLIWPLCPLVLYIIVRIWVLAKRNEMHDDPVVFILRDWRSQIMVGSGALLFLAAAYA
ncbi:UbiA family prenyltransferase [Aureimonas ureilytica]|uniref:UbiA family prenyltransferase n=1 Tax=Aureimonas ureilytica TaxID=401562 RepID=UPI000363AF75|nr:UbiA family prenyltransferase [Aureimonas ureilytica]